MTHLFIINPAAGSRDRQEQYKKEILRVCKPRGLDYQIRVSQAPGQCREFAAQAARSGKPVRIYACGGDGTLNEIVCGVAGYPNVAVTTYAGGSGNDFIRMFSQPEAFRDLEKLLDCQESQFNLIRCNEDYALNICSVGLDARIAADVAGYKRFPMFSGFRAYLVSALINTIKGIWQPYTASFEDETVRKDFTLICACNGRFYGGGFNPVPEADPTDGLLDVLLVKRVRLWQVPAVIGKYKNGRYKELPKLVRHLKTDSIRIICDKPTPVNLDGEAIMAQVVDMRLAEKKLRFFYPKGLSFAAKEPVASK